MDGAARSVDSTKVPLLRFESLCGALRSGLTEAITLKTESDKGAAAFLALQSSAMGLLELKEVNRSIWEKVAEAKDVCKRVSADMDVADLRLQNLQYEKNHLVRQIRHCRDFHFDEASVQLVDEATFERSASSELRAGDRHAAPHDYQVNRMTHELQQRQALCSQRDRLLAEKAALVETNGSKRAVLEGMGAQLQSLVRLSLPLQELLQQKMSLRWQEQRPLAVLPPPLRALFQRALAYRDTALPTLQVYIVGDVEKAYEKAERIAAGGNASLPPPAAPPETATVDEGESTPGGGRKKRRVVPAAAEEEEEEWLRQHALQVHVVLPLPSATARVGRPAGAAAGKEEEAEEEEGEARLSHSLELQFTCIPAQGLLAVTAAKQSATLLLHLLGEDGGTTLPPSRPTDAVLPTASQQKETLLALLPGQPFLWVQALGVATDTTAAGDASRSAEQMLRFGSVVGALVARVRAREALQLQLEQLGRGLTTAAPAAAQPPRALLAELQSWTEDEAARRRHRLFRCELSRSEVRLGAAVTVHADYPRTRPLVNLRWIRAPAPPSHVARGVPASLRALAHPAALALAERHSGAGCDNNLLQMEAELNCPRERVEGEEGEHCLGVMMHRLRMLLDVYVETEGEGGGSAAVCGTMCSRRVRGRDRRKPLIFDARSGQFDQSR